MTTIDNSSNFTTAASSPTTHHEEESTTGKKVLDTALGILQQMSMKTTLVLKNQEKQLTEIKELRTEVQELRIKLEQQGKEKSAIPPPPPPPPSSSNFNLGNWKENQVKDAIAEQKQTESDSSNYTNCVNGPKTLNPAITLTQIQKQLETLRKPEDKNAVNSISKETLAPSSTATPQIEGNLRQTQSLCIKPKNTTPSLEDKKNEQLELSVSERKKMFENPSRG